MKRIHLILTGLSATILLLSINRLTSLTSVFLQPYDFLRLLDFNAMLPIPLISVLLYYLLKREIEHGSAAKTTSFLLPNLLLAAGIFLFGAGSGAHEVTNYLNSRFCDAGRVDSALCRIVIFNDDTFSHLVYYAGFILLNLSLILLEYQLPRKAKVAPRDLALIFLNSLFIAAGIFANLAFEPAGLDLVFFGSLMLLSLFLIFGGKHAYQRLPVIFYFAFSYSAGVVSTLLYKLV